MFQMLSCFDLKEGVTIEAFKDSLNQFTELMQEMDLVDSIGMLCQRQKHPIMDTDTERDQQYYFMMNFRNRAQCDLAVEQIKLKKEPGETFHNSIISKISNEVFICWEEV